MGNNTTLAWKYFAPPPDHFWYWSDELDVLEWHDGTTLCFRSDLENVMQGIQSARQGLPPLGTVLLVLSACQDNWKQTNRMAKIFAFYSQKGEDTLLDTYLHMAERMLLIISELPRELRSGQNRVHLLHVLFQDYNTIYFNPENSAGAIEAFLAGWADGLLSAKSNRAETFKESTRLRLIRHFWRRLATLKAIKHLPTESDQLFLEETRPLITAWRSFYEAGILEQKLRTGLGMPPDPIPLGLPEPEPPLNDLLDELARDPETAGIARLTRRLIAAFHIPRHTVGASELPLGGVADITNRGDFDRLLLSELAQDELLLTARLVNNEAMFLRREAPPAQPERRRILLLDTTLKMWGVPRPFALSTALACARQITKGNIDTQAFLLTGEGYEVANLESKEGVVEILEQLHPALHCGKSLMEYVEENPPGPDDDCFLISDAEAMQHPDFQKTFGELKGALRFVISLRRDGGLEFYEFINGHRKLLSTARLDLAEHLFGEKKKEQAPAKNPIAVLEDLPLFYKEQFPPLYYPMTATRLQRKNVFWGTEKSAVLTDQRRVLTWDGFQSGATEHIAYVPSDHFCLGEDKENRICVLMYHPQDNTLELLGGSKPWKHRWPNKTEGRINMLFDFGKFFIFHSGRVLEFDPYDLTLIEPADMEGFISTRFDQRHFNQAKRMANRGYSTLQRANHIYVGPKGKLVLGNYLLRPTADLWRPNEFRQNGERDPGSQTKVFSHPANPKVLLYQRKWPNGSDAILDGRGLLHLRSANPAIPQVCLTLNLHQDIGMWSSDGKFAGNSYFLREKLFHMSRPVFYREYIAPILNEIQDSSF